jgi:hypothetical protein
MMWFDMRVVAVAAGLLLPVAPTAPGTTGPAWPSGNDYSFFSFARDNSGHALCYEQWHFGTDNIKTITHSKQTLRMKYRIERDRSGGYLVEEKVDRAQVDDCLSTLRDDQTGPRRYAFVKLANGSFFLVKHKKDPTKNDAMMPADLYGRADIQHPAKSN